MAISSMCSDPKAVLKSSCLAVLDFRARNCPGSPCFALFQIVNLKGLFFCILLDLTVDVEGLDTRFLKALKK